MIILKKSIDASLWAVWKDHHSGLSQNLSVMSFWAASVIAESPIIDLILWVFHVAPAKWAGGIFLDVPWPKKKEKTPYIQ